MVILNVTVGLESITLFGWLGVSCLNTVREVLRIKSKHVRLC